MEPQAQDGSLVQFLCRCFALQQQFDAALEHALVASSSQPSPTVSSSKGPSSQAAVGDLDSALPFLKASNEALRCSCDAVDLVCKIARAHTSAFPLSIPRDCMSLTPSSAFLVLYQHAVELVNQATRLTHAAVVVRSVSQNAAISFVTAANTVERIESSCWIDAVHCTLEAATSLCCCLHQLVNPSMTTAVVPRIIACRSPTLLRAWIQIAFFHNIPEAVDLLKALLPLDALESRVDLATLSDAYCLRALCLLLQGKPDDALDDLKLALTAALALKESSDVWMANRGNKSHILCLLLMAEAKRVAWSTVPEKAGLWLEDARLAAKLSSDESRLFSGVHIDKDVFPLAFRSDDSSKASNQSSGTAPLRVLPRMLHRLVMQFCPSLFVNIPSEVHAQCRVTASDAEGEVMGPVVTEIAASESIFWFDLASMTVAEASPRRLNYLHHLPRVAAACTCAAQLESHPCWVRTCESGMNSADGEVDARTSKLIAEFISKRDHTPTSKVQTGGRKAAEAKLTKGIELQPSNKFAASAPVSPRNNVVANNDDDDVLATTQNVNTVTRPRQQSRQQPMRATSKSMIGFSSSYAAPISKGAPSSHPAAAAAASVSRIVKPQTPTGCVFDRLFPPTAPTLRPQSARSSSVVESSQPSSARSGSRLQRPASASQLRRTDSASDSSVREAASSRLANSFRSKVSSAR